MDSSDKTRTRRLVLVHGAYHGGWCWRRVAQVLSARGVDAYTPTLTGLGQRRHLLTPETTLSTHIADIVNLFEFEDLDAAVLVGHSYAGMVIAGVAEAIPERIAHLVFLDAMVPRDGQAVFDALPEIRARETDATVAGRRVGAAATLLRKRRHRHHGGGAGRAGGRDRDVLPGPRAERVRRRPGGVRLVEHEAYGAGLSVTARSLCPDSGRGQPDGG